MKRKTFIFKLKIVSLFFLFFIAINSFGLNYTISFTASGAASTVGSVLVQNLTKGTTVYIN
jgi:hypothetical protein